MRALAVVLLAAVLTVAVLAADESSELRGKVESLTAENKHLKLQAALSNNLRSDAESSAKPSARMTMDDTDVKTILSGGRDLGEGFDSSNKIDLDADFGCPTGNPSNWIKKVEINTVTSSDSDIDYLTSGQEYKPFHFTIKQPSNSAAGKAHFGSTASDAKNVYWDGDSTKKVNTDKRRYFPSTSAVIEKEGDDEKYFSGKLMRSSNRDLGSDFEQSMWWKIKNGDCYAMAAYVGIKVEPSSNDYTRRCMASDNDKFCKGVNIRVMKFSVCKPHPTANSDPQCASTQAVVSCWYKDTSDNWHRCTSGELVAASILSRT